MKIRTFVVWGWARLFIYVVPLAVIALATGWFIATPTVEFTTLEKLPSLFVPGAWLGATYMLYFYRSSYAKRIAWVTHHGVSVVPGEARSFLAVRRSEIDEDISSAMGFFQDYFQEWDRIEDWFNGCALEYVVQDGPLLVPRYQIKAKELAYPKRMIVRITRAELEGRVLSEHRHLTKHSAGHVALFAMNVPIEKHHAIMKAAGWVDA